MKIRIECENRDCLNKVLSYSCKKATVSKNDDSILFEKPFKKKDEKILFDVLDYLHASGTRYNVILVGDL